MNKSGDYFEFQLETKQIVKSQCGSRPSGIHDEGHQINVEMLDERNRDEGLFIAYRFVRSVVSLDRWYHQHRKS